MSNFITKIFQNYISEKDIRQFKKSLIYYLIFRLVRKKLNNKLLVNIHNFRFYASNNRNKTSYSVLRKCDFEDLQEFKFLSFISKKNQIFLFDCGANFGFYSLYVASLNKKNKVISIEASNSTFLDLNENVKINNFQNIETINLAVSDNNNDIVELFESEKDWESSISHSNFKKKKTISIKTTSLDKYNEKYNLVDFAVVIKIDVEGHDIKVLNGSLDIIRHYSPLIIFEFSKFIFENNDDNFSYLKRFLIENNYQIFDSKYNKITLNDTVDRLNDLPKNMYGIGNYFLIKKNSKFETMINDVRSC
jgi:FkbM family methyltransferase